MNKSLEIILQNIQIFFLNNPHLYDVSFLRKCLIIQNKYIMNTFLGHNTNLMNLYNLECLYDTKVNGFSF